MPLATFFVEKYWPGAPSDEVRKALGRVRAAGRDMEGEGRGVRFLESAYVPKDESIVCLVRAEAIEHVFEAGSRAGIPFDRVTEADPLVVKQ